MHSISIIFWIFSYSFMYYVPDNEALADHLFYSGNYEDAITEYKRFVYINENAKNADSIYLQIALCYRYLSDLENSDVYLELCSGDERPPSWNDKIELDKAINLLIKDDYGSAIDEFSEIRRRVDEPEITNQATYYQVLAEVLNSNYPEAKSIYLTYFDQEPDVSDLDSEKIIALLDSASSLPFKDIRKARILSSFLPGSGQVYCKACFKEVMNAFLINGLMIAGATFSVINGHYIDAAIFAILFKVFYSGNRWKTEIICRNYNENLQSGIRRAILSELAYPYTMNK